MVGGLCVLQDMCLGGEEEWDRHLRYLCQFFTHKNYIKIDNRPLLVVYKCTRMPNIEQRLSYWRNKIKDYGFDDMFLVITSCFHNDDLERFIGLTYLFDAFMEFFPDWLNNTRIPYSETHGGVRHYDIDVLHRYILSRPRMHAIHYRGMLTGFDNTPRLQSFLQFGIFPPACMTGNSPEKYRELLAAQLVRTDEFLFVNAWNEWGKVRAWSRHSNLAINTWNKPEMRCLRSEAIH